LVETDEDPGRCAAENVAAAQQVVEADKALSRCAPSGPCSLTSVVRLTRRHLSDIVELDGPAEFEVTAGRIGQRARVRFAVRMAPSLVGCWIRDAWAGGESRGTSTEVVGVPGRWIRGFPRRAVSSRSSDGSSSRAALLAAPKAASKALRSGWMIRQAVAQIEWCRRAPYRAEFQTGDHRELPC
jgi:hypothetical protein